MASYAEIKKRVLGQSNVEQEESEYQKIKKKVISGYIKFDGVDDGYINSFLNDSNDFIKRTQESLQGADWSSHSSLYDSWKSKRDDLNSRADTIRSYLNINKSSIGEEAYNGIMSYLSEYGKADGAAFKSWTDTKNYFSQWDTEKDYNDAQAAWKDRTEKLDFDLDAGQAELDALRSTFDEYSKLKKERDGKYNSWKNIYDQGGYIPDGTKDVNGDGRVDSKDAALTKVADFDAKLSEFGDIESTIAQKTQYLNQAKSLQKERKLVDDATSSPDFKEYAKAGAAAEAEMTFLGPSEGNKIAGYRGSLGNAISLQAMNSGGNADLVDVNLARAMTDEEFSVYNYYYAKYGEEKANEYWALIVPTLSAREGGRIAEMYKDSFIGTAALAALSGFDQFGSGIANLDNLFTGSEADPVSPLQYASQEVRESLLDEEGGWTLGSVAYDLLNTTAHMAPTLVAGHIGTPLLGAATLGVSASGNAYADAVREGYDKDQARGYAALVGISEAGLQYALGGIGKLGGKATGNFVSKVADKAVSKVNSALGKAFTSGGIKLAGSMVKEFGEEYLQEVLTPVFKNIAFNTNEDVELFSSDALYAGILGALSAGLLEGVGTVGGEVATYKAGKSVIDAGKVRDLADFGKTFSADTVAYKIASKVDENTDAYTLGKLLREAGADSLSQSNMAEIQKELVSKGVVEADAQSIAKWLNKAVEGAVLTKSQQAALENNEVISEVYRDVILNPQSTVSQRTQEATGSSIALRVLAEEMARVNQKEQEKAKIEQIKFERKFSPAQNRQLDQMVADASETIAQKIAEEQFGVSEYASETDKGKTVNTKTDEGKTINTKTGEYVDVVSISTIQDGEMMLKVKNGDGNVETVNAKDVSFGNQSDALLYSMVTDMGVSSATAESIIKNFNPNDGVSVEKYALGVQEAYNYGKYSMPENEMSKKGFSATLTESQRSNAYNLGKVDAKHFASEAQKKITEAKGKGKKKGSVKFDGDRLALKKRERVSLEVLEKLSESLGTDFVIFESYVGKDGHRYYKDENGKVRLAPNGYYDPATGKIHIDLHAGATGSDSVILFTAAHELTHHIKRWSPEKFKVLADFLMEQYGKAGQSVDALVKEQIAKAKRNGRTISYDTAYEEVVADSMETMLADGKVAEKLALLKAKDKGLFNKIKSFFDSLVKKIKEVYAGLTPDSVEGQMVAEMKDAIERLQELFAEGLVDASANYQASEQVLAEAGIAVDSDTDAGSLLSVRDVLSNNDRQKVANALAERFSVTVDEAMKWLTAETSLASLILNPKYSAYLDYEADASETAIKQNSDYPQGTVDFSNICKKRREFTQVMNRVMRNFPNHIFAATDLAKIRTIMGEEGMTLPCGICYVEDRRQLDTIVAQDFIDGLKLYRAGSKTRPDGKPFNANQLKGLQLIDGDTYVPTIYELVTLEGRNSLKAKNPNMEAAWVKYNNARGMQSVRLLTNEAEYKRQILKYSKSTVQSKNDKGGLRIYSFSDAEMFHLIDIIQVITDSAAVGLSLQGYTKVNEYAKAVKDTGEKLNRSLIPKGELGYHIENGKVVLDYDTVEGIDITSKDFFDNKDNPNIGNITIGINDVQIRAAMVSDFVDQIIPFHTGQSEEVLGEKGIAAWDNYKDFQTEKDLATGKTASHQVNIYTEVIQAAAKEGKPIQNKRQFVEKFLAVCKENGLQPRFSQFLNTDAQGNYVYTEGYHKFLVDFKTFAQTEVGEYLPQMPVKPIFDNAYITQLLKDYVKEQQVKDAEVAKSMPKVIERITNEIIKEDVKLSDRDSTYLDAVNRGDMKAAQKMVEEAARAAGYDSPLLYHGTQAFGFTTVKTSGVEKGADWSPFFAANKEDISATYVPYGKVRKISSSMDDDAISEARENAIEERKENITDLVGEFRHLIDRYFSEWVFGQTDNSYLEKLVEEANPVVGNGDGVYDVLSEIVYDTFYDYQGEYEEYEDADDWAENSPEAKEIFSKIVEIEGEKEAIHRLDLVEELGGIYELYANLDNMFVVDGKGAAWNELRPEGLPKIERGVYKDLPYKTRDVAKWARENGFDGVIFKNIRDNGAYGRTPAGDVYAFFRPESQVKSADPVTYDDNGNVIPISERFNSKNDDIRYSDRDSKEAQEFARDIDRWNREGKPDGESFILGSTGDVLQGLGAIESDIYMQGDKIQEILTDHPEITLAEIKKIPQILENPVLILKSKNVGRNSKQNTRMVIFGSVKATNGNPILTVLDLRPVEESLVIDDMQKVSSAYTKTVNPVDFVRKSDVLYAHDNKKITARLLKTIGFKMPIELQQSGYIGSISYFRQNVNIQGSPFSDVVKEDQDILYSDRDPDAVSTRNLLANSLESAAQNDIERNKLKVYKSKIDLIEAEEAKLTELRAEIKELSFAKGPRDTAKIRKLQDSATISANRINTYDRQLLTLEASKPLQNVLQREKEMARKRQQQKDAENLRAYKEKAAATQRELMTRYQESRKSAVEGRHKTEMRHKIKSVVSELNNLLLHGSKERNVKLGLQPAVASALEAVNMDTVAAGERIAKLEAELMKAKTPEAAQDISRKIDNIRNQGDVMASRLEALRRAYADIKASSDNIPEHYRSEASLIADKVDSVMQKVGQTPLRNMNLSQLESVYELYKMVLTTVRNTNALFRQGKLEDLQNNVSDIMTEVSALPKLKEERLKIGGVVNSFSWNEMIPVYAFERIGSKTLSKFFWETIKGQNTYATDINEANEFAKAAREKFGYDKWDTAKVHEFKLTDGRTFRLTLKHMMSIYAYSKRNQALEHMRKGGFFFNDKETFRKKGGVLSFVKTNEEGYYVDEAVLSSIVGAMTQEQLQYVDVMQEYLTKMGEKGNEVSRVLWGIDIFKEKVYFPLKSSKDFIFQANQTAQEASLKNDGMTKEVKPGASNPIILEAFDDVWASHVNRMSQYHAFVLPIENLNKIHNYGSWAGTASVSVSTMLAARHGAAVNEYLTDFIKDLNGASSSQGASNPFFSLLSKFKKTAVAASASVVVQQPTAILRAMAVMDSKYFVGKPSMNWSEIKKYAPIAIIKEIGGFDAGAGRQAAQWLNDDTLRGTEKVMNKIDEASMKGAAFGDRIGWSAIWDAVKREIKATTNLQVGSEEFLQKAGERFTEVIVLTQVYDSTLSRSGYMRSKHDSVKMLTAFMGEPTVSFNMMYNAAVQAKRGNITKRKATRMLSAVYASVIAASAAASLVYALRDDDEDESYLEKFAEALGGKLLSDINPLNMLPAVRDIFSILDGWEVERTDVAIFQDIKNAFDALSSENKSAWRKIEDFSGAIASLFGLPLKNVLRTGREIYNGINDIFDGIGPSNVGDAFVRGITGEKKNKSEDLYNAIVNGDTARLGLYRKDYKDEKSYELAVRTALRENDSRIKEAAQARKDGDSAKYASIVREIISEGHFSQDIVVGAVNNELTSLNKGGSTSSSSDAEEKDASSIYSSYDINQALEDGDTRQALIIIEDIVKVKTENYINDGEKAKDAETKAKSSVRSSLTSYWKPLYLAAYERRDNAEMARIRNLLYATKLYGNASELVKTAQNWVKDSK